MKRVLLCLSVLLTVLLSVIVYSCVSDRSGAPGEPAVPLAEQLSIYDAYLFFDELRPGLVLGPQKGGSQATRNVPEPDYIIDWENACYSEILGEEIIDVPFQGIGFTLIVRGDIRGGDNEDDEAEPSLLNTVVRLVVSLDEYGEICYRLAYITPDSGWLSDREIDLFSVSVDSLGEDFSGKLWLHTLDGSLYGGYFYEDGDAHPVNYGSGSGPVVITVEDDGGATRTDGELHEDCLIEWYWCAWDPDTGYIYYCHFVGCTYAAGGGGGGGGGGSGGNGFSAAVQKAMALFESDSLTLIHWEELAKMLDSILYDCFGLALYNSHINSGNQFGFIFSPDSADAGGYNPGTNTIRLKFLNNSSFLFHEMFHPYQHDNLGLEGILDAYVNIDIEAYVAEYLYLSHLEGTDPREKIPDNFEGYNLGKYVRNILRKLDDKMNLASGSNERQLRRNINRLGGFINGLYEERGVSPSYDHSWPPLSYFDRIRELMKDC